MLLTAIISLTKALPLVSLWVREICALIAACFILPAPAAGAYGLIQKICSNEEVEYLDLWRFARKMLYPAIKLGFSYLVIFSIGVLNILFYFRFRNVLGGISMLVSVYICLFVLMMAQYHFALLANSYSEKSTSSSVHSRYSLVSIWKRAFYLVLGDPIYACGVVALTLIPTILMTTLVVPFMLLWLGYTSVLQTVCTRAQLIKYGVLPKPEYVEAIPDAEFRVKV